MGSADREFVREHHVHYEVEPEEVVAPDHREVTGYRVRLFATHGEDRLEEPACRRCVELRGELQAFAQTIAPPGDGDTIEVVSGAAADLQVGGGARRGEVHVTLRVLCGTPEHRRAAAEPERACLGAITRRLEELGVPRR